MRKKFAVAVLGLLVLSACKIRYEVGTVVEGDGSGSLSIVMAFDEEFRQLLSGEFLGDFGEAFGAETQEQTDPVEDLIADTPEGWKAERFKDGDLEGVRLSTNFADLEELRTLLVESDGFGDNLGESADPSGSGDSSSDADFSKGYSLTREGDIFTFRFEPAAAGLDDVGASGPGAEEFFGGENSPLQFEAIIRVTLPGKILEHNADDKNGNELVWRLTPTDTETASARSDASQAADSDSFPWLIVAVAALVIVAGAVGLLLAARRSKSGPPPPPGEGAEAAPPPPPPPPPA